MIPCTSAPNRRVLAQALAKHLDMTPCYLGQPTFSYIVGPITINRYGEIDFPRRLEARIKELLVSEGWIEPDEPPIVKRTSVWLAAEGMDAAAITNLIHMLYSKQYLIGRAVGEACIRIADTVIKDLDENMPEDNKEYGERIAAFRASGDVVGVELALDMIRLEFPYTESKKMQDVYTQLGTQMARFAREADRVYANKMVPENEKYYMSAWLHRIGMNGSEYKEARSLLLRNLTGKCAFRTEDVEEQYRARLAGSQAEKRRPITEAGPHGNGTAAEPKAPRKVKKEPIA